MGKVRSPQGASVLADPSAGGESSDTLFYLSRLFTSEQSCLDALLMLLFLTSHSRFSALPGTPNPAVLKRPWLVLMGQMSTDGITLEPHVLFLCVVGFFLKLCLSLR